MTHVPRSALLALLCPVLLLVSLIGCGEPLSDSCAAPSLSCSGECVDVQRDAAHCGACDVLCGEGEVCTQGRCLAEDGSRACTSSERRCEGVCVDVQRDASHCGACGAPCNSWETCEAGACVATPVTCEGSGEQACEGACVDVSDSAAHCGACGVACESGLCLEGECAPPCAPGELRCGVECVDPSSDARHCGASGSCEGDQAGTRCDARAVCVAGSCELRCRGEFLACEDRCVDTLTDVTACGECGNVCPVYDHASPACAQGSCESVCEVGFGDCNQDLMRDGCETSLRTTSACGACGVSCAQEANASAACEARGEAYRCSALRCLAGYMDCNQDLGTGGDGCESQTTTCSRVEWASTFGDGLAPDRPEALLNGSSGGSYQTSFQMARSTTGEIYTTVGIVRDLGVGPTLHRFNGYGLNAVVVGMDASGGLLWSESVTCAEAYCDVSVTDIAVDPLSGDVVVTGIAETEEVLIAGTSLGKAPRFAQGGFIARFDGRTGALEWSQPLINTGLQSLDWMLLELTDAGRLYLVGRFSGELELGDTSYPQSVPGQARLFLAELDPLTGSVKSSTLMGAKTEAVLPQEVTSFSDGSLLVVGNYYDATQELAGTPLPGMRGIFWARYTASLTPLSASSPAGSQDAWLTDVVVSGTDKVYLGGTFDISLDMGGLSLMGPSHGAFAMQVDPASDMILWIQGQNRAGDFPNYMTRARLGIDDLGRLSLGYNLKSVEALPVRFHTAQAKPGEGPIIVQLDAFNGNVIQIEQLFSSDDAEVELLDMVLADDGRPIFGGSFEDTTIFDDQMLTSAGGIDLYVLKLR